MKFLILTKEDLIRMLAALVLGVILGAAVTNLLLGYQLDQLVYENKKLAQQLNEEKQRLKQFEKDYYGTPVVQKVVLKLISNEDKYTEQELEKKIKDLLTGLVGLKINDLDPTILRDILHKRAIPLGKDTYLLESETIIIDDKLTFFIRVKKIHNNNLND
ncbi:hypothetical protein BBF96_15265 [Anoxybacter fermentans]|uniref:Sporulation membrane protein YtrI C-terminal domain-containing protein n=1 Tax=Anoxybacter fermentans TaxID=1323375 RepID=A0A3S9T216_9FIRM|nr:hypothetical protein [Anoxybacter fermentans]AZR74614.1 hypothetical protein BBF96_15265 [Anoxybacter fermentans]